MKFATVSTLFAACSAIELQHSAPFTTGEALEIPGGEFGDVARSCITEEVEATARRHQLTELDTAALHQSVEAYLDDDKTLREIITDLLHPYAHGVEGMTSEQEEAELDAILDSIWTCYSAPRQPGSRNEGTRGHQLA